MAEGRRHIIAVDFDGILTEKSPYPIMGKIREDAIKYINKLYNDGYLLVLWTCRSGDFLEEAINALKEARIFHCFTFVNEDGLGNSSRKIVAAFYIDDRAIMKDIDWEEIYNYIKNNISVKMGGKNE